MLIGGVENTNIQHDFVEYIRNGLLDENTIPAVIWNSTSIVLSSLASDARGIADTMEEASKFVGHAVPTLVIHIGHGSKDSILCESGRRWQRQDLKNVLADVVLYSFSCTFDGMFTSPQCSKKVMSEIAENIACAFMRKPKVSLGPALSVQPKQMIRARDGVVFNARFGTNDAFVELGKMVTSAGAYMMKDMNANLYKGPYAAFIVEQNQMLMHEALSRAVERASAGVTYRNCVEETDAKYSFFLSDDDKSQESDAPVYYKCAGLAEQVMDGLEGLLKTTNQVRALSNTLIQQNPSSPPEFLMVELAQMRNTLRQMRSKLNAWCQSRPAYRQERDQCDHVDGAPAPAVKAVRPKAPPADVENVTWEQLNRELDRLYFSLQSKTLDVVAREITEAAAEPHMCESECVLERAARGMRSESSSLSAKARAVQQCIDSSSDESDDEDEHDIDACVYACCSQDPFKATPAYNVMTRIISFNKRGDE